VLRLESQIDLQKGAKTPEQEARSHEEDAGERHLCDRRLGSRNGNGRSKTA
jgi:hypothetical protein